MGTNFEFNLIIKYLNMKKADVFFTLIFVVVAINVLAQDAQKSFLIKKEKGIVSGKTYLTYLDPAEKENYPSPKNGKGQNVELMAVEVNSIEKLNQIELKIFKPEEIKYLGTNSCTASCIISSSGKIISVSFVFFGWEPEVPVTKLQEYASQIKENIIIKCLFSTEPVQEGYLQQSIFVFRSLNPPGNVKSKVVN
jgi:hypothetical protein